MEFCKKYGRQVFAAFAANLGAVTFGTAWSWTATGLPSLKQDTDWGGALLSPAQKSLISSILFVGCFVSIPVNSFCIERYGRRATMLLANVPCLLGWAMIGFAPNVGVIYAGRLLIGVATACYGAAAPLYVSETADAKIRGRLVCTFDLMISLGMLFINVVGTFTPWRVQALVCGALPVLGHLFLWFAPESPRFLMERGLTHRAKLALTWFQPSVPDHEIGRQLAEVAQCCAEDKKMAVAYGWRIIQKRTVFKPILIGCMLMVFHQFSGNYPIQAYGVDVLSGTESGGDEGNPYLGIIIINTAQFISSLIPVFLVDQIGRRVLLLFSEIGMAITLGFLGLYFTFLPPLGGAVNWILIAVFLIYETCYSVGIGPMPWLLMGELVNPKLVGISLGVITVVHRVVGFAELFFFHDLLQILGQAGVYYFFGGCCLVGAVACYAFVSDTTGKTLDEIHNEDDRKTVMAQRDRDRNDITSQI